MRAIPTSQVGLTPASGAADQGLSERWIGQEGERWIGQEGRSNPLGRPQRDPDAAQEGGGLYVCVSWPQGKVHSTRHSRAEGSPPKQRARVIN